MPTIHPTLHLDKSVPQKSESIEHWATKATVVGHLRRDPDFSGLIETERKTGELIGDIRCVNVSSTQYPEQFVIEIERSSSNKDRSRATRKHLQHGYPVYWVFTEEALSERTDTEKELAPQMTTPPSFGAISLTKGDLNLGEPILWENYKYPKPRFGFGEFRIPTYDRHAPCYDYGDFLVDGKRIAILRFNGDETVYTSECLEDGQRTLPTPLNDPSMDLYDDITSGRLVRVSPIRGPP